MIRYTLLILILFALIAGSCTGRKHKLDRNNLIPEKELVTILTDIHISNGLASIPKRHQLFSSPDSLSFYSFIFEKHGYSKEAMDKTMKYYFFREPKKLIKIYDQVLGELSRMESLVQKEIALAEGHMPKLWKGKEFYYFADTTATDSARFDLTINRPGFYTLSYSAILFPDDQSVNPRMTVFSCHPDSIERGKRRYFETMEYIKDGRPHTYTLTVTVPVNTIMHLRGWLFDIDNHPDWWNIHAIIESISFSSTTSV